MLRKQALAMLLSNSTLHSFPKHSIRLAVHRCLLRLSYAHPKVPSTIWLPADVRCRILPPADLALNLALTSAGTAPGFLLLEHITEARRVVVSGHGLPAGSRIVVVVARITRLA